MKTLDKRLEPILKIAQKKTDEAARALGILNAKLANESRMLGQLEVYQEDYVHMMGEICKPGQKLDINSLMRYQQFINRLELAQRQQNDQIAQINAQKEQIKEYWLKTRARSKALEKVIQRDISRQQAISAKQEQKDSDEYNQNKFYRQMLEKDYS